MNSVLEELRRADSRIFDRLADGELCAADERTLLAALDDEPGAWRRAALAFIEAQALRRELGAWQSAASQQDAPESPAKELARRKRTLSPAARQLALAATVLLAFCAGLLCARSRPSVDRRDVDAYGAGDRLAHDVQKSVNRGAESAPQSPDDLSDLPMPNETVADSTVSDGTVQLTFSGETPDDDQKIELPLVFATHVDPQWFMRQESAVPGEVLDAWHKAGHVVTRRQEVWPVDLGDGRQMLLPVEQVEVDYAADRTVF
jgi:hypothetical protein